MSLQNFCISGRMKGSYILMSKKDKNNDPSCTSCPMKKTSIGGQALMEGIMMRGPKVTAMAVRNPQGEIVLEKFPTSKGKKPWPWRVPVIRGIFNFVDTMAFGYKCLMRSAEISGLDEAEEELAREKAAKKAAKQAKKAAKKGEAVPATTDTSVSDDVIEPAAAAMADVEAAGEAEDEKTSPDVKTEEKKESSALMIGITVVSVVIAFAIMIGLFVYFPVWLYSIISPHVPWMQGNRYAESVFCGILKIILLVGYMAAISLMKDIRRTFQFHGAEHKTIFCYEAGLQLTVANIRGMKRFHPRCGTSFLILMVLVSILVGFFIPPELPRVIKVVIRLALIPLIVGLGYELIKFCGRHDNWLTRIIAAPGMALQHITVFEPDDSMIECAIAAMNEVIPNDDSDNW